MKIAVIPTIRKKYDMLEISVDIRIFKLLNNIFPNKKEFFIIQKSNINDVSKANLVISLGGNCIEKGKNKEENILRKEIENLAFKVYSNKKIPFLGICYGAQFLAKKFKGKLSLTKGHVRKKHKISIFNKTYTVNSFHNYKIKKLNKNFEVLGKCINDDSCEAFKILNYPIYGIMWHPERNKIVNKLDKKILRSLL